VHLYRERRIALVRSPTSRITDNALNMLKSEWKLGVIKPYSAAFPVHNIGRVPSRE
jgi:hypothetical protein